MIYMLIPNLTVNFCWLSYMIKSENVEKYLQIIFENLFQENNAINYFSFIFIGT